MLCGTPAFTFPRASKKIYKAHIRKTNERPSHGWMRSKRPKYELATNLIDPVSHFYTQPHSKSSQLHLQNPTTSHHLVQAAIICCLDNCNSPYFGLEWKFKNWHGFCEQCQGLNQRPRSCVFWARGRGHRAGASLIFCFLSTSCMRRPWEGSYLRDQKTDLGWQQLTAVTNWNYRLWIVQLFFS